MYDLIKCCYQCHMQGTLVHTREVEGRELTANGQNVLVVGAIMSNRHRCGHRRRWWWWKGNSYVRVMEGILEQAEMGK